MYSQLPGYEASDLWMYTYTYDPLACAVLLLQKDELRGLQELFLLKPTTHYEDQMTDTITSTLHYPRKFPIDNDDYYQ